MGRFISPPECVLLETKKRIITDKERFTEFILEKYEITNKEEDYITSKEVIEYIKQECGMKLSDNMIGRILSELISLSESTKTIGKIKVRKGLKEKC